MTVLIGTYCDMNVRHIAKYEIVSVCGYGPVGTVYKARDSEFGEIVALKTIRLSDVRGKATDADVIDRFKQELNSVSILKHPNIAVVVDSGYVDDGTLFIATKYAEGESLETMIARRNRFGNQEILHYLGQLASAIDYAHSRGALHGNIKPSNVIINSAHNVQVLDFGLARFMASLLPLLDAVPRCPDYMAPEQIRGEAIDDYTDIFALGVIAFELFTARLPFSGKDFTTVANNILHRAPVSLSHSGRKLSSELEDSLHKCLAKQPSERFANALAFVIELGKVLDILVDGRGLVAGFCGNLEQLDAVNGVASKKNVKKGKELDIHKRSGLRAMIEWSERENAKNKSSSGSPRESVRQGHLLTGAKEQGAFQPRDNKVNTRETRIQGDLIYDEASSLGLFRKLKVVVTICGIAIGVTILGAIALRPTDYVAQSTDLRPSEASVSGKELDYYDKIKLSEVVEYDDELLARFLQSGNIGVNEKRILIQEAGKRSGEEFTVILSELARNSSDLVRVSVVKALAQGIHKDRERGWEALIALLSDESYLVRGHAAQALGKIEVVEARKALEKRLEVEEDKVVRNTLEKILRPKNSISAMGEIDH